MGYIGVDAGGTSWKVVLTNTTGTILNRTSIPTTDPDSTIGALSQWVSQQQASDHEIEAIGLSCFGPIGRDPHAGSYGKSGTTTKPGWEGANPREQVQHQTKLPCVLDSDVNGALLAEAEWGAGRGLSDAAYITVGTGVGGAALSGGKLIGSPYHGEFGHVRVMREAHDIALFAGSCPYHGDCVEGLASATAIRSRWDMEPHELSDDHEAWNIVTSALGGLCVAITYLLAPQRIIIGGGLLKREALIGRIRSEFVKQTNGFGSRPEPENVETYLTLPDLGDDAGALGGVFLAKQITKTKAI